MKTILRSIGFLSLTLAIATVICPGQETASQPTPKIETTYDSAKDRTTIRLAPLLVAVDQGKYRSLHLSPHFSFPGREPVVPEIVDFELQTVVKGRLRTDLYVVFVIDGEKVFLSSNRWAVKRPVPGRVWVGERLVFRMPYETFVKITKAKTFAIKFDAETFLVGETQKRALQDFLIYMPKQNADLPSALKMRAEGSQR